MKPDLLDPQYCACFNLRRAARKVTQTYDRAMKPSGLLATQFTLLSVIAGSDRENGIAMARLAAKLGMDRTTLTRNLAIAERSGWAVTNSGKDRRERRISLTKAGYKKMKSALPYWKTAQKNIVKQLSDQGLTGLLALTRQLETN